jgi:hypothetical protein
VTCVLCAHDGDFPIVNTIARNNTPQTSVSCNRCGLVQASPMPSAADLAAYYESGDYRREFPPIRDEFGEDELAVSAAEWLARELDIGASDNVLEIGCGYGRIAAALAAHAEAHVRVIEVDPAMRAEAEGRGLRSGGTIGGHRVVYAMQVLEHQPDPIAALRGWGAYLAPGGVLHVQVPTLERMYRGAAYFFQKPHVVNFTSRTLTLAFLLAGFERPSVSIGGAVLSATARVGTALSLDEALALVGPPDDVPAMIAAHERSWAEWQLHKTPGTVEDWIAGKGERPDDATLRHALTHLAGIAAMGMDAAARLSLAATACGEALDESWSLSPWVRGYHAGCVATHQRHQQATAHFANAMKVRATQ